MRRACRAPGAGGWCRSRCRGRHLGRPDGAQGEPVVAAQEVLADRAGGAHRDVEARRASVDALARPEVAEGVDEQHDVGVLVGVGRGDVQRARAQRDGPADPAQPVARVERPDRVELAARARPARPVEPDDAARVRGRGARVEGRGREAGSRCRGRAGPGADPEGAPRARHAHRHRADPAPSACRCRATGARIASAPPTCRT